MSKIVMPKNSALLSEIVPVLQIYYEAKTWISNDEYKEKLKKMIGSDQYPSSYTKKAQITSYFGFTIWEDINNEQSKRKITDSGKKMYEALKASDTDQMQAVLLNALETIKFGRNNYGCPESDSDVEPPDLFIRAILDLGYLTYREFAFILWKLEDLGANYTDTLEELRTLRNSGALELDDKAKKYADCKPIMMLVRWGFLSEDDYDKTGGKHIIINPEVLSKYETRLRNLKIYNIDMDYDDSVINGESKENTEESEKYHLEAGCNIILYGVPGSGKSWTIKNEYCDNEDHMERLVFHPDYMYSDFVGQIMPAVKDDGRVIYEFTPGPFTKLLKKAYDDPANSYYLIIEEINRGNAPAIFGDIFQLLDRIKTEGEQFPPGTSEYGITNASIGQYVYGDENHKVRIPSNMSILATMNTSDQNVFTMDTAFQRRWTMRIIPNSFENHPFADKKILDTDITWQEFCNEINSEILSRNNFTSSEDKRLGAYFISESDLELKPTEGLSKTDKISAEHDNRIFAEKVIKYLWDDAFKFSRPDIFDTDKYESLERVINAFMDSGNSGNKRFRVFSEKIRKNLNSGLNETAEDNNENQQ